MAEAATLVPPLGITQPPLLKASLSPRALRLYPRYNASDIFNITNLLDPANVPGSGLYYVANGGRFTTQLLTPFVLGAGTFVLFCFMRWRWPSLFSARMRLKRTRPRKLPRTLLGWIMPVLRTPESFILHTLGLDAIMFLRFYKTCMFAFLTMSLFGLAVMIPVNWAWEKNSKVEYSVLMLTINIRGSTSPFVIAHIVAAYFNSIVAYFFLNRLSFQFLSLRWHFLIKSRQSLVARTVMFENLRKEQRSASKLLKFVKALNIGRVEQIRIIHVDDESLLPSALKQRAYALKKWEHAYYQVLGNPCEAPDYDPDLLYHTIMTRGLEARKREAELLDRWAKPCKTWPFDFVLAQQKNRRKKANRPLMRFGWKRPRYLDDDPDRLPIDSRSWNYFKKIDAIDYWRQAFWYWDTRVAKLRATTSKRPGAVGFVTFEAAQSAHIASQVQLNSMIRVNRCLSVEPRAIYWPNISLSSERTYLRSVLSWIITVALMIFWIIPVTLTSTLLNMRMWEEKNPGLKKFLARNDIISGFLSYTLPGVFLLLYLNILPWMLKWVAIFGGCRSRQAIDYTVLTRHFAFLIINVIFIFMFSGTILNRIFNILNSPTSFTAELANSLPSVAPWFAGYVLLLGVGCQPFKLILLRPAIWYAFKAWFCKTPRDYANTVAPIYIDWGNVYPYPMMVFWIAMLYSSFSPLILPISVAYYGLGFFVLKYQMLYVFFRDFESAGMIWPRILLRLVLGILVYQVVLLGYLIESGESYMSAFVAPLILYSIAYLWYRVRRIRIMGEFVPLQLYREADEAEYRKMKRRVRRSKSTEKGPSDATAASTSAPRAGSSSSCGNAEWNFTTGAADFASRDETSLTLRSRRKTGNTSWSTSVASRHGAARLEAPFRHYSMTDAVISTGHFEGEQANKDDASSDSVSDSTSGSEDLPTYDETEAKEILSTAPASWLNGVVKSSLIPPLPNLWLGGRPFGVNNLKRVLTFGGASSSSAGAEGRQGNGSGGVRPSARGEPATDTPHMMGYVGHPAGSMPEISRQYSLPMMNSEHKVADFRAKGTSAGDENDSLSQLPYPSLSPAFSSMPHLTASPTSSQPISYSPQSQRMQLSPAHLHPSPSAPPEVDENFMQAQQEKGDEGDELEWAKEVARRGHDSVKVRRNQQLVQFVDPSQKEIPTLASRSFHRRTPTPSHLVMAQSNPGLGKRRVPSLTHTVLYTHKRARKAQRRASKMIRRGVVQMIQGGVKDPARPFLDYTRDDASSYDENFAISAATRSTGTQGLRLGRAHAHRHNNDSISRSSFSGSISSWFSKRPQITTHGTGPKDIANSGGGCDAPTTLRSLIDEMSKEDNCGDSLDQQHPLLHPPLPPFALAESQHSSPSSIKNSNPNSPRGFRGRSRSSRTMDSPCISAKHMYTNSATSQPHAPWLPPPSPRPPLFSEGRYRHHKSSSFVQPTIRSKRSMRGNASAASYRSASLPIDPRQLANYQRFSAEAQHILEADKYSDYSQAPMHKVDGVLDDSLYDFINPAVFGKLPTLWLPMKSTSAGTSKNSSASPPTALTQN